MNRKRNLILPLFSLLFVYSSHQALAQTDDPKAIRKLERAGEKAVDNSDWDKVKEVYGELIKGEPGNSDYNFYLGLGYLQSDVEKEKSVQYFEKVNVISIPQRDYFYGQALHYDGQYDQAIAKYETLIPLALDNKKGKKFKAEIEQFITYSENAKRYSKSVDASLRVDNLGATINTEHREYAPIIVGDRESILFAATSKGEGAIENLDAQAGANEDIYFSDFILMEDAWGTRSTPSGNRFNKNINSNQNESPISYDENSDKLTIYRTADLFVSTQKNEPVAEMIDILDLTADDITAVYESNDGMYRFVVTDVLPGKGGLDIFISKKSGDSWSEWKNMDGINTPLNDDSPYIAPDGSFYFSSQGHDAMGGHDIFKATKSGDSWANPTNLGMPINSPANDIHFSFGNEKGDVIYLASDRKGTKGSFDIYRIWKCYDVPKTTINGRLLAEGKPLEKAKVYLKDADSNNIETIETDANGNYQLSVQTSKNYIVEVSANNYLNQAFGFEVPAQCAEYDLYQTLSLDVKKDKDDIPVAQTASIENAFYEVDRYREDQSPEDFLAGLPEGHRLKPTSQTSDVKIESPVLMAAAQFKDVRFGFDSDEVAGTADAILGNVATYMTKFETVTVILKGHTDTKGPKWYNERLSKRRANSVSKILVDKGVAKDRIKVEFYGEKQPLTKDYDANGNYLEQEAEKNRRVEIEVVIPEETTEADSGK